MVMIVFTLDFHKLHLKSGKIQNAIAFLSLTVFVRNRYFLLTAVSKYMKHEATYIIFVHIVCGINLLK